MRGIRGIIYTSLGFEVELEVKGKERNCQLISPVPTNQYRKACFFYRY